MKNSISNSSELSLKTHDEEHGMISKSNKIEIMIKDKPEEVKHELFQSLFSKYQN